MARKAMIHKIELKGKNMVDAQTLADKLGVTIFHIRRLARDGDLTATKLGKRWWFDLDQAIEERLITNDNEEEYPNIVGI